MRSLIDSIITSLLEVRIFKMRNKRVPNVYGLFGIYGAMAGIYSYAEYGHWYAGIDLADGQASSMTLFRHDEHDTNNY